MTLHSFLELGLDPQILTAIQQKNYQTATPIQAQAIPLVLKGRDLLAQAPTGSGKTAAYVLPLVQKLILNKLHQTQRLMMKIRMMKHLIMTVWTLLQKLHHRIVTIR